MNRLSKSPRNRSHAGRTRLGVAAPIGSADQGYWRIHLSKYALMLAFMGILVKLVHIQIVRHEAYAKLANEQYTLAHTNKAARGLILDRNQVPLAFNRRRYDVSVYKKSVKDAAAMLTSLSAILKVDIQQLRARYARNSSYVVLARGLPKNQVKAIEMQRLEGIAITRSTDRTYPFKRNLAQTLGFANVDGTGISGIELQYDKLLRGTDGWTFLQKDARGKRVMPIMSRTKKSRRGGNVILTVDNVVQSIAEEELRRAVIRHNAKGGTVVVTNPGTGEILGLASTPGFDPNRARRKVDSEAWRIRGITDIFEPGSTFKIATMLAALTSRKIKRGDLEFCENGSYQVYNETINDSEGHGYLTFDDIFIYSSNIGTAKTAAKLGKQQLYRAARDLGFGSSTGVELPGEVSGILKKPSEWTNYTLLAMSYGHEVAVTALQMAMAYGAIANGGMLMKPAIVQEILDERDRTTFKFKPQVVRQVMQPKIAAEMAEILTGVVEKGTGKLARIEGIEIAGKTGTAQKVRRDKKGYSKTKFVASFACFYPAEQARLLIYMCVDEPNPNYYGGTVVAPAVKRILERISSIPDKQLPDRHKRVPSSEVASDAVIPKLVGHDRITAERVLRELGIKYRISGAGNVVQSQHIPTLANPEEEKQVLLVVGSTGGDNEHVLMPKVTGMSLRQAIAKLSGSGLSVKVTGTGRVVGQQPSAGSEMRVGATCHLECRASIPASFLPKP